jgi:predicted ATPase with chaperone activity
MTISPPTSGLSSLPVAPAFVPAAGHAAKGPWFPAEPTTLEEIGLSRGDLEGLILKQLLVSAPATGRKISDQVRLPFSVVQEVLRGLKQQLLVAYKGAAAVGDYDYELTDTGLQKARWHAERCTYCGSAPVTLKDYCQSVAAQSVHRCKPKMPELARALADLSLAPEILSQIGQAVHGGRGLFIHGAPGNGKTSIAERLVRALDPYVWIPRTINLGGEIIRLFDPSNHEEVPVETANSLLKSGKLDRRYVRIKRPSIVVGGELTFAQLDLTPNPTSGIIEAPVQLKANLGALVVDDFGRQRISTSELLNRWIVPLEKRHDYLLLPSGRQIQVPFDELLIFSTNLDPRSLVDEAFLRRIPYKIQVQDPQPAEFRELIKRCCGQMAILYRDEAVDHLLAHYFANRPLRYCHPRDLCLQVKTFCEFHDEPGELTPRTLDAAAKNYFGMLESQAGL